jgi:hypothetical protein
MNEWYDKGGIGTGVLGLVDDTITSPARSIDSAMR